MEIRFQSKGVSLAGTLMPGIESKRSVTILMLHGSGPMDRYQNMRGQKLDVFNTFAAEFEKAGFGSFRYDKRGCGKSGGNYYTAGFGDLIEDACVAVDMLARRPETGAIVLLGHSEGTIIAPVVAHLRPNVSGMILLCPTVQPLEKTLMLQAQRVAELFEELPGVRGTIARLYARFQGGVVYGQKRLINRTKTTSRKTIYSMMMKVPVRWLKELLAHDLEGWMRKVRIPVLAISGAKDIQCLPSDGHRIEELAQGPVEVHCLDDLTHILRSDTEPGSFRRYEKIISNEMDPRIMLLCLDWVSRQKFGCIGNSRP